MYLPLAFSPATHNLLATSHCRQPHNFRPPPPARASSAAALICLCGAFYITRCTVGVIANTRKHLQSWQIRMLASKVKYADLCANAIFAFLAAICRCCYCYCHCARSIKQKYDCLSLTDDTSSSLQFFQAQAAYL